MEQMKSKLFSGVCDIGEWRGASDARCNSEKYKMEIRDTTPTCEMTMMDAR